MKLFSNLNDYAEFTLPELQADKEDTDNFEAKFWGKEPILSTHMAVRLQGNFNCCVCCSFLGGNFN